MAFLFQCPQDHLLEGEESQAGQAINCPVCGMLFIIPEPSPAAAPVPAVPETPPEPEFLHIPCPNGHELEVPAEMLDTEVLCPQCNAQFHLRAKDSIEHIKRREQEQALREAQTNKFWYQFSIGVVVVVALLLLTLMVMSAVNRSQPPETKPGETKPKPKEKKLTPPPAKMKPAEEPEIQSDDAAKIKNDEHEARNNLKTRAQAESLCYLHLHPLAALGAIEHGVANLLRFQGVAEGRSCRLPGRQAF